LTQQSATQSDQPGSEGSFGGTPAPGRANQAAKYDPCLATQRLACLSRALFRRGALNIGVFRSAAVIIALSIVAGAFLGLDGNAQVIPQTVKFTALAGVMKNPGIGYQTFGRSASSDAQFPSSVLYTRFDWSRIEPAPGIYDFTSIDLALSRAQSAGQRLAFRVMGFKEGNYGPVGLKNAGYPGYAFTFHGYGNVWFPNLNQSIVQQDLAKLIAALGRRYGNNPSVDSIDIGYVGDWGEFHFWNTNPTPPMPSTATLIALQDHFLANVRVPLVISGTLYSKDVNAFNYAIQNKIGWRVDCWGDYSPGGDMYIAYPALLAGAPNAWKYGPIFLETCNTMAEWVASGYPWQQALQWAIDNHISAFNNQSATIPPVMYPAVRDMLTKIGYRFVLTQAQLPTSIAAGASFNLTLNWTNKGNAPMYFERHLLVKVGNKISDTGISMKGFLPGMRADVATVGTKGLVAGTYPVQIGLAAPGTQIPDIRLAIQGTAPWYTLGNITLH
jgi:Domain of unknown function (DUF4832)